MPGKIDPPSPPRESLLRLLRGGLQSSVLGGTLAAAGDLYDALAPVAKEVAPGLHRATTPQGGLEVLQEGAETGLEILRGLREGYHTGILDSVAKQEVEGMRVGFSDIFTTDRSQEAMAARRQEQRTRAQSALAQIPQNQAVARASEQEGFLPAVGELVRGGAPAAARLAASNAQRQVKPMLAYVAGRSLLGPAAGVLGMAGASFNQERDATLLELVREETADGTALSDLLQDPDRMNALRRRAARAGAVVGLTEGAFSLASTGMTHLASGPLARLMAQGAGTALETAGEGIGEMGRQAAAGLEASGAEAAIEMFASAGQSSATASMGLVRDPADAPTAGAAEVSADASSEEMLLRQERGEYEAGTHRLGGEKAEYFIPKPYEGEYDADADEGGKQLAARIREGERVPAPIAAEKGGRAWRQFLSGSPEQVTDLETHQALEQRIESMARAGAKGRYWYEQSGTEILRLTGGNRKDAETLVKLIAITSPQNPVPQNWDDALQLWGQYQDARRRGERVELTGAKTGDLNRKAERLLYDGEDWKGVKTNNFYNNLMRTIDPERVQGITVDIWVMRSVGYGNEQPTKNQYRYAERTFADIADRMGWEPQQLQAAVWEATKHIQDQVKPDVKAEIEAEQGKLPRGASKDARMRRSREVAERVRQAVVGYDLEQVDPEQVQTLDYSHVAAQRTGLLSVEAIPGRATGLMPGIHDAPMAQRQAYSDAIWQATAAEDGTNEVLRTFGLLAHDEPTRVTGYYQGDFNPAFQIDVQAVKAEGASEGKGVRLTPEIQMRYVRGEDRQTLENAFENDEQLNEALGQHYAGERHSDEAVAAVFDRKIERQKLFRIEPGQQRSIEGAAAAFGYLYNQESVGYHRPVPNAETKQQNGAEFRLGRSIKPEEAKALYDHFVDTLGEDAADNLAVIGTGDGFRVLNFQFGDNVTFHSYITDAAKTALPDDLKIKARGFGALGDLIGNNYKEDPDGTGYLARISSPGRPDVQRAVYGSLRRRVAEVNLQWAEQYGWGDPEVFQRQIEEAAAVESAGEAQVAPTDDAATTTDADPLLRERGPPNDRSAPSAERDPSAPYTPPLPTLSDVRKARVTLRRGLDQAAQGASLEDGRLAPNRPLGGVQSPSSSRRQTPVRGRLVAHGISREINRYEASSIIGKRFGTTHDLAHLGQIFRNQTTETARLTFTKGEEIVGHDTASIRVPGSTKMFPVQGREAMAWLQRRMQETGADKVYLMHNHPSGNPDPSTADLRVTANLRKALGDKFGGHVVIDSGRYAFISGNTLDPNEVARQRPQGYGPRDLFEYNIHDLTDAPEVDALLTPDIDSPVLGMRVTSPDDVAAVGAKLRALGETVGRGTVALVSSNVAADGNAQGQQVRSVLMIRESELEGPRGLAAVRDYIRKSGAQSLFVAGADLSRKDLYDALHERGMILDAVDVQGHAYSDSRPAPPQGFESGVAVDKIATSTSATAGAETLLRQEPPAYGRPDLANPGRTDEVRGLVDDVDEYRNQQGLPGQQTFAEWGQEADRQLGEDYDGVRRRLLETPALEHAPDVIAAQKVLQKEGAAALASGDSKAISDMVRLVNNYRSARSETARALAAGRDPNMSPEERRAQAALQSIFEPSKQVKQALARLEETPRSAARNRAFSEAQQQAQTKVKGLEAALSKSKDALRTADIDDSPAGRRRLKSLQEKVRRRERSLFAAKERLRQADERIDAVKRQTEKAKAALEAEQTKQVEEIREVLKRQGIDLAGLTPETASPETAAIVARTAQSVKAAFGDQAYEYWINLGLLSAPTTQAANILGNTVHSTWEYLIQRPMEAAVNAATGGGANATTFGELPHIYKAMMGPAWRGALKRFTMAFSTEQSHFAEEMGYRDASKFEDTKKAIPGKLGRGVRIPGRLLVAADEAAKHVAWNVEVAGQAYRIAKREGLKGEEMQARMQALIADPTSEAGHAAYEKAVELTFQAPLKTTILSEAREKIPGLRYILPFITTPTNILKTGVRKSPLGGFALLWRAGKHGLYKRTTGRKGDYYERRKFVRDGGEQILAWVASMAVGALVANGEDDEPFITGTLPPSGSEGGPGRRQAAYRAVPATSVKLFGKYRDYSRLEPLSTSLVVMVDFATKLKEARSGREAEKIWGEMLNTATGLVRDKSFLAGIGDIINAIEDPGRYGVRWAQNFATSWSPNIIRRGLSAADPVIRDTRARGEGKDYWRELARRTGQRALPLKGMGEPTFDVWGRPRTKGSPTGAPMSDYVYRLTSPVRQRDPKDISDLDRLLLRYNNRYITDQWWPALPSPKSRARVYGEDGLSMNSEEYQHFVRLQGIMARSLLLGTAPLSDEETGLLVEMKRRLNPDLSEDEKKLVLEGSELNFDDPDPEDIHKLRRALQVSQKVGRYYIWLGRQTPAAPVVEAAL